MFKNWKDQFEKSMGKWKKSQKFFCESDVNRLLNDVDYLKTHALESRLKLIDRHFENPEIVYQLVQKTVYSILDENIWKIAFGPIIGGLAICESPIECIMFLALSNLVQTSKIVGFDVVYVLDEYRCVVGLEQDGPNGDCFSIEPQAQIGDFRVDFLLTYTMISREFKKESSKEIIYSKKIEKKMIIECDGHDFHERTKEQAKRDKSRDRDLQSVGYLVYRYTGSEIWNDVFDCASQCIKTLQDLVIKEDFQLNPPPWYQVERNSV